MCLNLLIFIQTNEDSLGGFIATDGAGWTMGALFATTSGVPFEFPVGNNDMDQQEYFASGIYNLGDFLHDQGYNTIISALFKKIFIFPATQINNCVFWNNSAMTIMN